MSVVSDVKFQVSKLYIALFLRAFLLLSPIVLLFYQENGLTYKHLFLFQGIFYLTSIISEAPIGYLSDTTSRKKLLILSLVIFWLVTVLWLFYHGFWVILCGEILFAVSKVMMDNATSGYLYDYLNTNNQHHNMVKFYGYLNFFLALGTAVAAIFGSIFYLHFGSKFILSLEFVFAIIAILLVNSMPEISRKQVSELKQKIKNFITSTKSICKNESIRYHILYSGLLTSFSILFALSFQPLMQRALFPVFMFGVITFFNHGIRALSGIISGKFQAKLNIHNMILPLFFLYILAFLIIFIVLSSKNIVFVSIMLFLICLIIGVQLLFTILHVSRLHKFVTIDNRGNLMSLNNGFSRVMAAIILISSKILMDKFSLFNFYIVAFALFLIACTYVMIKTYQVKE